LVNVQFEDIWFRFPGSKNNILSSINWNIDMNGSIGILGTNGSGKTTFLKLIAGILSVSRGIIRIDDKIIKSTKNAKKKVIYVPENAKLFLIGPTPRKDLYRIIHDKNHADSLIDTFNFNKIADKKLYHLSEGQRRLFAIFSAFQTSSRIILLDEPTIALDSNGRNTLFELLRYAKSEKKLVLIATNDPRIYPITDELIVIHEGHLRLQGKPYEVLYRLEEETDLVPNQIVSLINSVEREKGIKIPHCISVKELNKILARKGE